MPECKSCEGWVIGLCKVPASEALAYEVIPARIPGHHLTDSVICCLFLFINIHCRNTILNLFLVTSSHSYCHFDFPNTYTIIMHNQHTFKLALIFIVMFAWHLFDNFGIY